MAHETYEEMVRAEMDHGAEIIKVLNRYRSEAANVQNWNDLALLSDAIDMVASHSGLMGA